MGARTDAALEEVLAARTSLGEETERLKISARAAVDVKARVKRNPGKAAGAAAGAAFVAVGGPKRVLRAVKRRVRGEPDPLPASLLPGQIDRAVRALGDDGAKVRGALERGFADYLEASAPARKKAAREGSFRRMLVKSATPLVAKAARQALDQAMASTSKPAGRDPKAK